MPRKTVQSIQSVGTGMGESPDYLHVHDDHRGTVGVKAAKHIDDLIRQDARMNNGATEDDAYTKPICMGCALAVYVNAMLATAKRYDMSVEFIRDHVNQALDDLVRDGATRADIKAGYRKPRDEDGNVRTGYERVKPWPEDSRFTEPGEYGRPSGPTNSLAIWVASGLVGHRDQATGNFVVEYAALPSRDYVAVAPHA